MNFKKQFFLPIFCLLFGLSAFSQSLDFDGLNDQVNLGSNTGNGIRTVEMWFVLGNNIDNTNPQWQTLVAREWGGGNFQEFSVAFAPSAAGALAGRLVFTVAETGVLGVYPQASSLCNSWVAGQCDHMAAVIDPASGMHLFIDGVDQNTNALGTAWNTATVNSNSNTYLGCWGSLFARFFNGEMDDVRFSSVAEYTGAFTPAKPLLVTPSITSLWALNEGIGAITADLTGNEPAGVITSATWIDESCGSNECVCSARVDFNTVGVINTDGTTTSSISIDTDGIPVTSICVDLPFYQSTVDPNCLSCDNDNVSLFGSIVSGSPIAGIPGVLVYGPGSKKICYTFPSPTVVSQNINLTMQFPPILDLACCQNSVDYCLDVTIWTDECTSCEYSICNTPPTPIKIDKAAGESENNNSQMTRSDGNDGLKVILFPNPANEYLDLEVLSEAFNSGEYVIVDATGKIIKSLSFSDKKLRIDTSDFERGSYTISIKGQSKMTTKTFVIK